MPEAARRRVAVAGGGTAGHVLAGVAVAQAYRRTFHAETFFIGCASGFESRLAPARGEELVLIRGLPYARQDFFGKISALFNVLPGVLDARRLLRERRTELLVGVGGYPSISAALAARSLGIPVVIHEANAFPGLANKWVGTFADGVCAGFEETMDSFRDCPAEFTGSPAGVDLRDLVKRTDVSPCVLVTGGSEGSPFLNLHVPELIAALKRPQVRVWHLAGAGNVEPVKRAYEAAGVEARVDEFIDNMEDAYAEACFVICCPGALTLAEVAQAGLLSLLVPLSTAANDHQAANAKSFCKRTGASWVAEKAWDTQQQAAKLGPLLDDPVHLAELGSQARSWARPEAAAHIVQLCEKTVEGPVGAQPIGLRQGFVFASVAAAMVVSFLLRVLPAYTNVFTPDGINFQEGDPWFHVRTVQNLLAHFPWRSGFDPYAVYPGGSNLPTGPFWDYLMATVAWILGAGSPGFGTAERVAAWLPAVMGALLALPVFWLSRRLFDNVTGIFAVWWVAILPGTLLWTSHLGMADHHIAESMMALLTLGFVCAAAESKFWPAMLWTLAAGLSLGAYLATRPAGIFVIGILVAAVLLKPELARISIVVLAMGAVLFIPVSGILWSDYTWASLVIGIVVSVSAAVTEVVWRNKEWSRVSFHAVLIAASVMVLGVVGALRPELFPFLLFQWRRAIGAAGGEAGGGVLELMPLLKTGITPWRALFQDLGSSWILALPGLIAAMVIAWRKQRPGLVLFAVWSAVMAAGAFGQVRMTVYFEVNAAILAGLASAWLVRVGRRPKVRLALSVAVFALMFANLPIVLEEVRIDISPSPEWRQAFDWLRRSTPEPLGESSAWSRYDPASATPFVYPPSAYSVTVWWEYGYWLEYLARRIPSSNGMQQGANQTAAFYADTDPETALHTLDRMGSRYVMVDDKMGFDRPLASMLPMIISWAGHKEKDYLRAYVLDGQPVFFYLPALYRTMAMRLLMFDGKPSPATEIWVIHSTPRVLRSGRTIGSIDFQRKFQSEQEARKFLGGDTREEYALGSFNPNASCVALEAVPGLRLAYSSGSRAVKVFERAK